MIFFVQNQFGGTHERKRLKLKLDNFGVAQKRVPIKDSPDQMDVVAMKNWTTVLFAVVAGSLCVHATPSSIDPNSYFEERLHDSEIGIDEANLIVMETLTNGDAESVARVVYAMGFLAGAKFAEEQRWWGSVDVPERRFHEVPGLKEFLFEYWRAGVRRDGFLHRVPQTLDEQTEWRTTLPPWEAVPGILVTYYPGDSDVYDFIWEIYEPTDRIRTLFLLNGGTFRTPEANQYRIACLEDIDPMPANTLKKVAATSLGRFQSSEGLNALGRQLNEADPLREVVEAITLYGKTALPYMDRLREVTSGYPHDDKTRIMVEALQKMAAATASIPSSSE